MKTITKTFNVYTIDELKEINPIAYKQAIETASNQFLEEQAYWQGEEFIASAKAVAKEFNFEIADYSFSAYNGNSYMDVDAEDYMNLTNSEKKELVSEMNQLLKELHEDGHVDAKFTGIYYDELLFEHFKKNGIKEVSFNDLHKQFDEMVSYGLKMFLEDVETQSEEEYIYDSLYETETLFTADGAQYDDCEVA